ELFSLLAEMARIVRRDGMLALEPVISDPENSTLLAQYPRIHKNHHASDFLCSGLALFIDGANDVSQLTTELDKEIEVVQREQHAAISVLSKTADALHG